MREFHLIAISDIRNFLRNEFDLDYQVNLDYGFDLDYWLNSDIHKKFLTMWIQIEV